MSETYEFPASFGQRRLWLLDRIDPGLPTYNVPWAIQLSGPLDPAALHRALTAALARHEALRTVFRESADRPGQPVQVVADTADLPWRTVDLTGEADPAAAARRRAERMARTQFDLRTGPLLRAELLRLAPDEHVLLVVYHHIVADGWSLRILVRQMIDDYAGRPVPEPPIQYADFAVWQAEQARRAEPAEADQRAEPAKTDQRAEPAEADQRAEPAQTDRSAGTVEPSDGWQRAERYWSTELAGADPVLALPTERVRPQQPSLRGDTLPFAVADEEAERLRRFAREHGVSLFTVLLAGFAVTLARLAGRDDLLVGVPVAGREQPETEQVVGLFMNTLPVRLRPRSAQDFATLLTQVRDTVAGALAHQQVPFERIVEICRAPRELASSPLTQVMFQLEELPGGAEVDGLRWRPEMLDNGGAKLDLTLMMVDDADGLTGRLIYATDLFDAAWAGRFVDLLRTVLHAAVRAPGRSLGDLPLLPAADLSTVTVDWATGPQLPAGPPTAIEMLADAWPTDEPARIAGALRRLGVGPEDRVGLCLPRDDRLIPALLGIWWAGAGYVPLDPDHPPARTAMMIADAGVDVVLGTGQPPPGLADAPRVRLVDLDDALVAEPVPRQPIPATAAAYTIFTSGSTGRPKGVTVDQGNVAALLTAFGALLPIGPADHLVAVTTVAFDISVLELLLPLVCRARVTVADAGTVADAAALRRLVERTGATVLQATPATWRALLTTGGVPAGVRLRICGGEAMPRDLADALLTDDAQLWNVYGPTETTVWSTAAVVAPDGPVLVGTPIPGTRCYVLDDRLQPVPPGVVGEVFLGGAGVARGYQRQPGRTAERFVPDPFSTSGGRLYATGDLARWRTDGTLELLGRADHQVKIRGFRIEPGEIEVVLRSCPGVTDAVVTVTGGPDPRLVAYVVGDDRQVRGWLTERLPGYLVPAAVVTIAALPRTANGKLDRAALPAPDWSAGAPTRAASTDTERHLVGLWQELLGLTEAPGVDANFFALGGHSLTATALIARIGTDLRVDVPLRTLFRGPTIAELARAVDEQAASGSDPIRPIGSGLADLDDDELDDLLQELMR
ncbi:amino acid adenylation domain-containing protein [Solwaraspora sp. WMMD406]|uniref:non-ribosomal peptide synthetase n=1 Tax=Solwaraspora sp. WMMD406 TaxID=3016095 RepID=UPI0024180F08|nr:amino acid adenylation domain-containing protein [Solwaraspora sp. WMMD406]MDG4765162.1 amino acid adenylation domain-containing protein [Solwaraspora sp. WMMD406]